MTQTTVKKGNCPHTCTVYIYGNKVFFSDGLSYVFKECMCGLLSFIKPTTLTRPTCTDARTHSYTHFVDLHA